MFKFASFCIFQENKKKYNNSNWLCKEVMITIKIIFKKLTVTIPITVDEVYDFLEFRKFMKSINFIKSYEFMNYEFMQFMKA